MKQVISLKMGTVIIAIVVALVFVGYFFHNQTETKVVGHQPTPVQMGQWQQQHQADDARRRQQWEQQYGRNKP